MVPAALQFHPAIPDRFAGLARVPQMSYVGTGPLVGWLAGVQICTCDML